MEETCILLDQINVTLGRNPALIQVDWEMKKGEHWAVLGDNGAGKSTFLKLVRGDIWPDRSNGGMRVYSLDAPPTISPIGLRHKFGIVSSELEDRYIAHKWTVTGFEAVLTGFYDTPYLYTNPTEDEKRTATAVMDQLGIGELADRKVTTLSRGEAAKVLMARSLVSGPFVLVLDECLAGLDGPSRRSVLDFLNKVADEGVQLICACHRLDELPDAITHVLWLENGRVRMAGPKNEVLPEISEAWHGHGGPMPGSLEEFFTNRSETPGEEWEDPFLIRLKRAGVVIRGRRLLHPVDWTLRRGERWAVVGPNGAGKSTFLSLLHRDLPPYAPGKVEWFGVTVPTNLCETRRRIGFVSPAQQAEFGPSHVGLDVVISGFFATCGLQPHQEVPPQMRENARVLMEDMGIGYLAERKCDTMSYGQFRRTLLARAVVGDPEVLLLDEPLNGLDAKARESFLVLLEDLALSGVAMVHATHYFKEIQPMASHVIRMEKNRVVYQGTVEGYEKMRANGDRDPAGCTPNAINEFAKPSLKQDDRGSTLAPLRQEVILILS